ncbi:hypothetical protein MesoLj113b_54790 [Mesorhizobium sp. 113-3-3]|nr:hypothetical protein MesoLj113b_54790 [Mesorhizobium sp. 113-3-3]
MKSCSVAAMKVEIRVMATCQGWRSVMRTIRSKVLRPLPQEASATWANDLPRFAALLVASVGKENIQSNPDISPDE